MYQTPRSVAQCGVKGGEEGLVKILDGVKHAVAKEFVFVFHTVESGGGGVQKRAESESADFDGINNLGKQSADDRRFKRKAGSFPFKLFVGVGFHPRGEESVKDGLHQGGAEKVIAAVAFKFDSQRGFQRFAERGEGVGAAGLQVIGGFAGVGGEQVGDILGFGNGGVAGHCAAQEFPQGGAALVGNVAQLAPEFFLAVGEFAGFQNDGFSVVVALHQGEAAIVGCEDEAVSVQVFSHLFGAGEFLEVVGESLDFAGAAVGFFAEVGVGIFAPALDLSGGEKPEVGLSVSPLSELEVGVDLGFEFGADGVEQFLQRAVVGDFVYGVSGANVAHSLQITADFLLRGFCFGRHGGKFNPFFCGNEIFMAARGALIF